jgi:hypothetical protein
VNSGGIVLAILGVWVITQLVKGDVLARIGLVGSATGGTGAPASGDTPAGDGVKNLLKDSSVGRCFC